MQVVLVMFKADGTRRSFPLTRDVTVIGRREDCDLRIPLTEVSRKHCRIVKDRNGVRVEDLGSSNGTYHNGSRVQESIVQPGDQLQVGPVSFTVQVDGFPPDDMITPPQAADSSTGAQLDDSAGVSPHEQTVAPPRAAGALGARPLTPEGDDFNIVPEASASTEDDLIDFGDVSPSSSEDKK